MGYVAVRYFRLEGREVHSGQQCDDLPVGWVQGLLSSGCIVRTVDDSPLPDREPEPEQPQRNDEPEEQESAWSGVLPSGAAAALDAAGLLPGDVASMSDEQLLQVPGVGKGTVRRLRETLNPGGGDVEVDDAGDGE